ncbi:hypothetical protein [Caballeronia novacaledonica]|uniref:EF-hand domain-containing protein n=1 Tax=Caballeronia novacaledonica TaxID=1544861 RepID=A0AA37ILQ1_9BURK|nr:hypothetical protein [Caballeronia novacaledonica]GJH31008.1 hypothetical protein CBA19CS42_40850 [Caballeronia novacaledonica]
MKPHAVIRRIICIPFALFLFAVPSSTFSLPCFAFCGSIADPSVTVGNIIDQYIATPSIDHLGETLGKRADEVTENARRILDKLATDKLAELDDVLKSNIDLAYDKLRQLSREFSQDLSEKAALAIEAFHKSMTESIGLAAFALSVFTKFLAPTLIGAAIAAAIISVLRFYLLRRRSNESTFPWKPYLSATGIIILFGVGLAYIGYRVLDFSVTRYNENKMVENLSRAAFVEAAFYSNQLQKNSPTNKTFESYTGRSLLLQDFLFRPVRGKYEESQELIKRAKGIINITWSAVGVVDKSTLSVLSILHWINGGNRTSEYIGAQMAATVLQIPNNPKWPLDGNFDDAMKDIIRKYLIAPLDDREVVISRASWKDAISDFPVPVREFTVAEMHKLVPQSDGSGISAKTRILSLHIMNAYFHLIEGVARVHRYSPSLGQRKEIADNAMSVLSEWDAFLHSNEYVDSSKSEKLFLLKAPIALLARLRHYVDSLKDGTIDFEKLKKVACANYDIEADKRDELTKMSDRGLRSVSSMLAAPGDVDELIDALTIGFEKGRPQDRIAHDTLLAIKATARNDAQRGIKELYNFEYEFVSGMAPPNSYITDCLLSLPKKMKCGQSITYSISTMKCPDGAPPDTTTTVCVRTLSGVFPVEIEVAEQCPDMSIVQLTDRETTRRLKKAGQNIASLGMMTCDKSQNWEESLSNCDMSSYRTPAYRTVFNRYINQVPSDDVDKSFMSSSLLPTS